MKSVHDAVPPRAAGLLCDSHSSTHDGVVAQSLSKPCLMDESCGGSAGGTSGPIMAGGVGMGRNGVVGEATGVTEDDAAGWVLVVGEPTTVMESLQVELCMLPWGKGGQRECRRETERQ